MKRYKLLTKEGYPEKEYKVGKIYKEDFITNHTDITVETLVKAFPQDWKEVTDEVKDNINPEHYTQGKIECIDAMESATTFKGGIESICVGNIIKYLWRYESKNGLEDVKKAKWYLEKLIKVLEEDEKNSK